MITILDQPRLVQTGTPEPLSESVIPAVPGKYYAYSSVFTDDKPLYALMDCKANKSRTIAQISALGREVHLIFEFDAMTRVRVSSTKAALAAGLLVHANIEFDDVWVAPAHVAIEDFYTLCAQRNSAKLADICKIACHDRLTSSVVASGTIVAVMTNADKYGLFLAKKLASKSVSVDACHVLLP